MKTTFLSALSLLYIDSLDFKDNLLSLDIKAGNGSQDFLITLEHILSFDYSKDSLDEDIYVEVDVLEVIHEYRKICTSDFKSYMFFTNDVLSLPELNIIKIYGSGKAYNFICKEVKVMDA
jgi:hypothetical protein